MIQTSDTYTVLLCNLIVQISTVILGVINPALDHLGYILCQHHGRFSSINSHSLTALVRSGKQDIKSFVDYLLIKSLVQLFCAPQNIDLLLEGKLGFPKTKMQKVFYIFRSRFHILYFSLNDLITTSYSSFGFTTSESFGI